MKNILLPTDFSVNAQRAIRYALIMFGKDARYTLLNTYDMPYSGASSLFSLVDVLKEGSEDALKKEVKIFRDEFPHLASQIETLSLMGDTESVVTSLTEKEKYDLVVMGTKGATGLKEVLVGSVAASVMQNGKCPVFAVPENATLSVPQKIAFAVDDVSLNEGIFPTELADLIRKFDAHLLILNVIPEGNKDMVGNAPGSKRQPTSVFEHVRHSFYFVEGDDLNKAITDFTKDHKVDVLAMVTRKTDFFSKLFGLSSTKKMMQHIDVPIIAFH